MNRASLDTLLDSHTLLGVLSSDHRDPGEEGDFLGVIRFGFFPYGTEGFLQHFFGYLLTVHHSINNTVQ